MLLLESVPLREDLCYDKSHSIPTTTEDQMAVTPARVLHPCSLALDRSAAAKEPLRTTVMALVDEMLVDGMKTSTEPLLIMQPEILRRQSQDCILETWEESQPHGSLPIFSVGFIKGAARAASLHMILHIVLMDGINIRIMAPKLFISSQCIFCHHLPQADVASWILTNARFSARGSIRRAWNVIQWMSSLCGLKSQGMNALQIIKRWNSTASKQSQLVGSKKQAVCGLLDSAPAAIVDLMLKNVSKEGFENSAWLEDALASRKILPGYSTRCSSKIWGQRLQVTGESMLSMVQHVSHTHASKPLRIRKKLDRADLEDVSLQAALVHSLAKEAMSEYPISHADVEAKFIMAWERGEPNLQVEILTALADKSESFAPRDIGAIHALIGAHCENAVSCVGKQTVEVDMTSVEKQEFDLVMSQLEYDRRAVRLFQQKYKDRNCAVYHQKLQWTLDLQMRCKAVAKEFLDVYMLLDVADKIEVTLSSIGKMKRDIVRRFKLADETSVAPAWGTNQVRFVCCCFSDHTLALLNSVAAI